MAADQTNVEAGAAVPGVEAMLAQWTQWMQSATAPFTGLAGPPGGPLGGAVLPGVAPALPNLQQWDPLLRAVDQVWNANPLRQVIPVDWAGITWALRTLWLRSLRNPAEAMQKAADFNARFWRSTLDAWTEVAQRWWGIAGAAPGKETDKRFAAPEWRDNPAFRTLKELYILASDYLLHEAQHADDLDPAERQRLDFHLRQFVDAMSPTLLLFSNPAALRRAVETGGASIADGVRNLLSDLKEGRLSMVDATAFKPGRNLAMQPGKVVLRNRLIELIQYNAQTETVHETPLLILPPWINKYYVLDMQPKNSMVKYLVDQGFTVFMVSWKNPDASMEDIAMEDYMELGPIAASDAIRDITGAPTANVMGYCIGGTLLAMTLAYLAARGEERFNAATFIVSLQDFSTVGDTAVFLGGSTVDFIEQQMLERGYLDSREMSNMFNLLRSNDLIWSNVVNNYLLGQKPPAFDLLYWNSDGTRMARTAHSWYLRNTYVENNLMHPCKVELKGEKLDLSKLTLDIYAVGAEKDHIVPWQSAWRVTQLAGGQVRYVLASSGHIAGIINPPGGKGTYWTNDAAPAEDAAAWQASAQAHNGSWWQDWSAWLSDHGGNRVAPPPLGTSAYPQIADAPGTYVLEK